LESYDSYQQVYTALEKNFQPRGDDTFIELSERFFNITLSEYKDIEDYTKALKKEAHLARPSVEEPSRFIALSRENREPFT